MKSVATHWTEYKQAVEAKQQPRSLHGAFIAGMKATLDLLADPFRCPHCLDRADQIAKETDALAKRNGA